MTGGEICYNIMIQYIKYHKYFVLPYAYISYFGPHKFSVQDRLIKEEKKGVALIPSFVTTSSLLSEKQMRVCMQLVREDKRYNGWHQAGFN